MLRTSILFFALSIAVAAEEPWSISSASPVTRDTMREIPPTKHIAQNFLIRFYQDYISPLSGSTCYYTPTCSRYTAEAVSQFGLTKGIVMGLDRLIRCHPGQTEYPVDYPRDY